MYAMLTLDLEKKTEDEKRDRFYEILKDKNWIKLPKVTTTWIKKFKADADEMIVIALTKLTVQKAAKSAGVTSYNAVVHVGSLKPTSF